AYNRDLQEDKRPLFDAFDTVEDCLKLAALVVSGANLKVEHIKKTLDQGFLDATTLMEWLIKKGVPQRTAHEVVGKLVALCERRGCKLTDLSPLDLQAAHSTLSEGALESLGAERSINAFKSSGSTAPGEVKEQLLRWKKRLF